MGSDQVSVVGAAALSAVMMILALAFLVSEFIRFRRRKTPGYAGFISIRSTGRRIAGSLILIALALMFYAGLHVVDFSHRPVLFGAYWIVCCLLAFLLFLLGLYDFREVRQHRMAHELKLLWRMTQRMAKK